MFQEKYASIVSCEPYSFVQAVAKDADLFKELVTSWRFTPNLSGNPISTHESIHHPSCYVDFNIAFEFASPIHAQASSVFFDKVSKMMLQAFIDRSASGKAPSFPFTMFMTRSEYDRGVNTFSPEGRLFQVEYAIEAIKLGTTAIGIQTSQGVVLAVEKRVSSPLLEASSIEKIMEVDTHLAVALSGMVADARTMIDFGRVAAQNHRFTYDESLKVESLTQSICDLALRFGESADGEEAIMSRPFGVALLIAGADEKGPQLFHADPSGTFMAYNAKAIGSGSEGAQTELEKEYHKSMTLEEAETLALRVLKSVMEEKLNKSNIQVASVTADQNFKIYEEQKLQTIIDRL
ncbi:proteasome component PUP2 [Lichtheimia hyalospora FSU 10163]|nr:proteasome component PUP2 [Lichtheimia hyalospora FSU 10163]